MKWLMLGLCALGLLVVCLPESLRQYLGIVLIGLLGPIALRPWVISVVRSSKGDFVGVLHQLRFDRTSVGRDVLPETRLLRVMRRWWSSLVSWLPQPRTPRGERDGIQGDRSWLLALSLLALAGSSDLPAAIPASFGATMAAISIANKRRSINRLTFGVGLMLLLASACVGDGFGARLVTSMIAGAIIADVETGAPAWLTRIL
jgi:hypothetical protein